MERAESVVYSAEKVVALRKLVAQGEGLTLEFKRKAAHPDKIVHELIAFANTQGGILLVGVDDNSSIPGVKFPEEESVAIRSELKKHCRPAITFSEEIIALSMKSYVLQWTVPKSDKRPHYFVEKDGRISFVRWQDESLQASREMCEIIRRNKSVKGTRFTYGDAEQKLMQFLDQHPTITLRDFAKLTGMKRFFASRKLVRLVLAGVLKITPAAGGDLFSRV